jgi:hypothetical protein
MVWSFIACFFEKVPLMRTLPRYLAIGTLALVGVAASAQSTKPGLWEISHRLSGNAQIDQAMAQMQQQMAAMPPEQRKMMEEMMARQGMAMPKSAGGAMALQVCITPEMAARQELPQPAEGDCSTKVTSRSGNSMGMRFECKNPPSSGEGTYTFKGDNAYSFKMTMKTVQNGKAETVQMDGQGKWLSASCGNIQPVR